MQEKVLCWMEACTGEKIDREQPVHKVLKDGVIICKVINKLMPGQITKVATKGLAFQLMENHSNIQKAMKEYGVTQEEIYQTPDLFEGRNVRSAINSLFALGRTATNKGWDGPAMA